MSVTHTLMATGDLVLEMKQAAPYFADVKSTLNSADITVGHGEVPFTSEIRPYEGGHAPPCDPMHINELKQSGFDVVTLAGNHIHDSGYPGIRDTVNGLKENGILPVGAGKTIKDARAPVTIDRDSIRYGVLSYNCVGPSESWATSDKAGCAYLKILTHYELDHANPGGTPNVYTFAELTSLGEMTDNITELKQRCDVVVVSLHKGLVHKPVKLAMYEQPVCYAAIDAGADLILGHHSHILKGIELYRGKPIFHGLGNFVTVTKMLTEDTADNETRKIWARRRKEIFGFEPDPAYPKYPFHPDAKYTIIAKCLIENGKIVQVGYIPCLINKEAKPEIVKNDERGKAIFQYMNDITKGANLNAHFEWSGDEVVIQ